MDIFVEQLIQRKQQASDYIKKILCVLVSTVVVFFSFTLLRYTPLSLLVGAFIIYFLYNLYMSTYVEFEYCFTNGAFDVDKIIAARKRRRITELNARSIEIMAPTSSPQFKGYMENHNIKKIYACTYLNDEDTYFVVYERGGQRTMLLFNPNEQIRDGFRRLSPQKVFFE